MLTNFRGMWRKKGTNKKRPTDCRLLGVMNPSAIAVAWNGHGFYVPVKRSSPSEYQLQVYVASTVWLQPGTKI